LNSTNNLDEDIKKIQETTKLIRTTSSYAPISDLTAYSGADGCIDMEAYLLEFANQMHSNFEKLNLIEGSFFRKNLGMYPRSCTSLLIPSLSHSLL
jgi:hypothetical protein